MNDGLNTNRMKDELLTSKPCPELYCCNEMKIIYFYVMSQLNNMKKYKQTLVLISNWIWTTFGSDPGDFLLRHWGCYFLK